MKSPMMQLNPQSIFFLIVACQPTSHTQDGQRWLTSFATMVSLWVGWDIMWRFSCGLDIAFVDPGR